LQAPGRQNHVGSWRRGPQIEGPRFVCRASRGPALLEAPRGPKIPPGHPLQPPLLANSPKVKCEMLKSARGLGGARRHGPRNSPHILRRKVCRRRVSGGGGLPATPSPRADFNISLLTFGGAGSRQISSTRRCLQGLPGAILQDVSGEIAFLAPGAPAVGSPLRFGAQKWPPGARF
jgi:hypothetical protein